MKDVGPCFVVFGVSGVGKSTACRRFAAENPEYIYAPASGLLEQVTDLHPEALRLAPAMRILENQQLLGPALAELREGQWERPVLLDAHAVIDNDEDLVAVPVGVIRALHPTGFILLDADAEFVVEKRRTAERKRPQRTLAEVKSELVLERSTVETFARSLAVPLQILKVPSEDSLKGAIEALTPRLSSL